MIIKFKLTVALNLMFKRTKTKKQNSWFTLKMCLQPRFAGIDFTVLSNCLCISQFQLRPKPPPHPPPPGWLPRISSFLSWMANFRGWGLLSCQMPRGGNEKRGQKPRPPSKLQHFSLTVQSNSAFLNILMCEFLFLVTSFFVIALGFELRLHAATTCTSLWF